ncbi:ParB N-terminal domain-containing protein [Clostridium sp.]|uniref:ParB N-terminal domain-containing protein n=1 Tax=Clostridium sp. TaxID=1506 RepID=UPI00284CA93D|nr:ParB N-terminal domain-containing protein [Clostridium sp.]MDR3597080.1 ParB N-terminal domain-containing protein [Clostridium sp.]
MLNELQLQELTHKLYKNLTVLPLSSLMTEDNLKTVVFKTTKHMVTKADGTQYIKTTYATINMKYIKEICDNFRPLEFTPILVNKHTDDTYRVIEGWHRIIAADSMKWTSIPCYVLEIPCGEEYGSEDGLEWKGGFVDEDDINGSLTFGSTGLTELYSVLK